jgi:SpoVK/Ycf46/Vps4 family AAA+-type ATPase
MVHDGQLSVADIQVILEEKCQVLRKTDLLEFIHTPIQIGDVGGLENLKRWLAKRKNAWLDAAARYGLPAPRGILLTGVPGCGKSLVAKAIGSAWQLPLLRLDPGRIYGGLMGSSEENIRKVIKITEAIAPCILWIDEIEKGFSTGSGNADSGTSKRVFGSFLTWLQEKTASVFVIATANDISGLPPEMMRKGRFDEIFFVDLPNRIERQTILALHLKKRLKDPAVIGEFRLDAPTMARLVDAMEGFNGAEIEQVVIAALFEAFSEQRSLRLGDLEAAITNTVPLVTTQAEQITALRRWAQARAVAASVADIVAPTAPVTPAGR